MGYPDAAWERAMTVQAVILKAVSGEIHWFRAAEILGWSPRTLRRWRERYGPYGYAGLVDKRLRWPSIRRAPPGEVERVLRLYRKRYAASDVRHFHEIVHREHGVTLSYGGAAGRERSVRMLVAWNVEVGPDWIVQPYTRTSVGRRARP